MIPSIDECALGISSVFAQNMHSKGLRVVIFVCVHITKPAVIVVVRKNVCELTGAAGEMNSASGIWNCLVRERVEVHKSLSA